MARFAPIHPGEILRSEFLDELGITPSSLAKNAGINKGNLSRIINGKSAISADIALRLAVFFWHVCRVMDEFAMPLRPGNREGPRLRRIEQEVCSYQSLVPSARA